MLKQGIYKAENGDSIFDSYEIVMEVKETEKSFIFKLIKLENRSGADRIQLLFSKSNKVILRNRTADTPCEFGMMITLQFIPIKPESRIISS